MGGLLVNRREALLRAGLAVVTVAVFLADRKIELGVAAGVLYILPVWMATRSRDRSLVWVVAAICCALTVSGFFLSPAGGEMGKIFANRALAVFVVLLSAWLWSNERVRAEESAKLAAIIESSEDAILVAGLDGVITRWNAGAERLYGYSENELRGQSIRVLAPEDRRHELTGALERIRRMEPAQHYETIRAHRDGRAVHVSEAISPVFDLSGQLVGISAVARDVTQARSVAEAVEEHERRWQLIVQSALDAVIAMDETGAVIEWNPRAESIFGWTRQEAVGRTVSELIIPERLRSAHEAGLARYLETGEGPALNQNLELIAVRRDGVEFPVELTITPSKGAEGWQFNAFVRDITDRQERETKIARINEELRQKNEEMTQFVYTVSHDLKSPLLTCRGFASHLRQDLEHGRTDRLLPSIERIERASQRMSQLIEDLLELSRIGIVQGAVEVVDVNRLVESLAQELSARLQDVGAQLAIQKNLPPVRAEPGRIAQLFENLLGNAIKYGCRGDSPRIEVGAEIVDGSSRFFVKDDGPGIAAEHHRDVFGLFRRLESDQEGTGVGLAVVARIMDLQGGKAWVESEPGHGATFWVSFPALHDDPSECGPG